MKNRSSSFGAIAASLAIVAPVASATELMSTTPQTLAAQTVKEAWYDNCAVLVPVYTRHVPDNNDYNNSNYGLVAECKLPQLPKTVSIIAGDYNNSYGRETGFAGVKWMPVQFGTVSVGAVFALDLTNGYGFEYADKKACSVWQDANGQYMQSCKPTHFRNNNPIKPFIGAFQLDVDLTKKLGLSFTIIPGLGGGVDRDVVRTDSNGYLVSEPVHTPSTTAVNTMLKLRF